MLLAPCAEECLKCLNAGLNSVGALKFQGSGPYERLLGRVSAWLLAAVCQGIPLQLVERVVHFALAASTSAALQHQSSSCGLHERQYLFVQHVCSPFLIELCAPEQRSNQTPGQLSIALAYGGTAAACQHSVCRSHSWLRCPTLALTILSTSVLRCVAESFVLELADVSAVCA